MNIHLVVVQAFGPHPKGALITDDGEINAILASEYSAQVVKIQQPPATLSAQEA